MRQNVITEIDSKAEDHPNRGNNDLQLEIEVELSKRAGDSD
jgi:hypothetical protein